MKHKSLKSKSFVVLLVVMFLSSVVVAPMSIASSSIAKEEVVYGILNANGSVDEIIVVNSFDVLGKTKITDYTSGYETTTNLTNGEEIKASGDTVELVATQEGRFSYNGVLKNASLPWVIDVKYFYQDKEIQASELYGKSGKVGVAVSVSPESETPDGFFDTLAVQMSAAFSAEKVDNITGDGITVSSVGGSRTVSYVFMPNEGGNIYMTMDVEDFEFSGLQFVAVPLTFDIEETFDVSSISGELTTQLSDLEQGIHDLSDGIDDISDGTRVLTDGMIKFNEGLKQLRDGANLYFEGVKEFNSQTAALKVGNQQMIDGTIAQAQQIVDGVNLPLPPVAQFPPLTESNYKTVLTNVITMLSPDPANAATIATIQQFIGSIEYNIGVRGYMAGVGEIMGSSLQITGGVGEMAINFDTMTSGAAGLLGGVELYQNGVNTMSNEVYGMGSEVETEINQTIEAETESFASEFVPKSFVSERNQNVEAIQFVLKTEGIEKPSSADDEATTPRATEQQEDVGVVDKIRELFELMF